MNLFINNTQDATYFHPATESFSITDIEEYYLLDFLQRRSTSFVLLVINNTHSHFMAFCASARRNLLLDFMVQGKVTEADTPTIRLGATPLHPD